MSDLYKEDNSERTNMVFAKRVMYRKRARRYAANYSNFVDFNRFEKFLYGRVDRSYLPIVLREENVNLKSFDKTTQQGSQRSMRAFNFVVDAFKDLSLQFEKCALTGKIDPNDPYLSNLTVHAAYESPKVLYDEYKLAYFIGIANSVKKANLKIRNFEDFIFYLLPLLEKAAPRVPFTLPAYIKSRRCPINVSGLAVEIADLNPANDEEKVQLFFNSKNWEFYLNACRSYGFMVDQLMPWRLVADIGSSAMLDYATKYGIKETDQVFYTCNYASDMYYIEMFRKDLLRLYNMCTAVGKTTETEECNGRIINKYVDVRKYTQFELKQAYPPEYFIDLYFKIRFLEDETVFSASKRGALVNDCLAEFKSTRNSTGVIFLFETILNKPFDYRGSLTYNNTKHIPALRDEAPTGTTPPISTGTSGGGY